MPRSSPARRVVAPSPRRALTSWSRASYLKLAAFSVPSSSPPPPPPLLLLLLLLFSSSSSSSSSPPPPPLLLLLRLCSLLRPSLAFPFFVSTTRQNRGRPADSRRDFHADSRPSKDAEFHSGPCAAPPNRLPASAAAINSRQSRETPTRNRAPPPRQSARPRPLCSGLENGRNRVVI